MRGSETAARPAALPVGLVVLAMALGCRERAAPPAPAVAATPAPAGAPARPARLIARSRRCMGTDCTLTAWHHDEGIVDEAFRRGFDEMDRIEILMTPWRDSSTLSRINAAAGGPPVPVDPDTMAVLKKARWVADLTDGAFDITVGVFKGLWKFDEDSDGTIPARKDVLARLRLVDYRDLVLDEARGTAQLRRKGQSINLGGIAKGYAVDAAAKVIRAAGVRSFLAQAGGDLFASGRRGDVDAAGRPTERDWVVGIQDPRGKRHCAPDRRRECIFAEMGLSDAALPSSGDYERFLLIDGKRYHHILDPKTGHPAARSRQVTILAADAFTADALDTALFIIGPERAMKIIEDLPDIEGIIVGADNRVHVSSGLRGRLRQHRLPTDGP